ncbi:MAG: hypothetical protein JWO06_1999, partial [Bacteroidota bacterium]|nr:hypothetical protein [Bacteroidota bacterium]
GYILLYNKWIAIQSQMTEAWVLIDIKKQDEKVFTSADSLNAFAKQNGVGQIKLYDVNPLFEKFKTKGELPAEWPVRKTKVNMK